MSRGVKRVFGGADMRAAECGPLEASWDSYPRSIDMTICRSWSVLVARSRMAMNDDGFFTEFVRLAKDNIAGSNGFLVESNPVGTKDRIDGRAKDLIDEAWKDFSELGNFDVSGQYSRVMFEQLWVASKVMNGEALALIVLDESLPWGMGLQLIDPMRLDPCFNEDLPGGNYIRHSIEFNRYGRPVAYHFSRFSSGSLGDEFSSCREDRKRVDAEFVIHDFLPEFVGQKRGLPWGRSVLWRLRMFSRAEDSMIANLRASASKMGFFHSDGRDEEPAQAGAEGDDEQPIAIDNADAEFYDIGNRRMVAYAPQFPDQAVEPFMRTLGRGIASGLGTNYYKLFNDLSSVSFSSIRQGELSERDYWRSQQTFTIDRFVRPVRMAWLKFSLLAGRIGARNRWLKAADFSALKPASFKGRSWAWIDPQSEAAANALMLERNMTSLTDLIADQGKDFWEFLEKVQSERKEMAARGIVHYTTPGAGVLASPGKNPV